MKVQTIKASSVTERVQFARVIDGKHFRATIYKSAPNVYTLRWNDGAERLVEVRGDEKITLTYDLSEVKSGLRRCTKHGFKIQRPRGEFDCETCFREYGQRARAAAKARKAQAAATGVEVRPETQAERAARLRKEAADAKVARIMERLERQGKALWQQPEPDYSRTA